MTLRPCREESVDFDNTENLYIEGDNLEVLKILRETYLGKVKMIYIDPPYNTGNDFIYNDDFSMGSKEYNEISGNYDDERNRLMMNNASNGRFHTDWLNMIYPRLKLAKDLLSDDGVIFVSIDDNEQENLKKICDEIFGSTNFVAQLATVMNLKGNNDQFGFAGSHEYTLVYLKNATIVEDLNGIALTSEDISEYVFEDEIGKYKIGATLMRTGEAGLRTKRPKGYYPIYVSSDYSSMNIVRQDSSDIEVYPKTKNGIEMSWRRSPENLMQTRDEFIISPNSNGISFYKKQRLVDDLKRGKKPKTLFYKPEYSSGNGTSLIKSLFGARLFDNPKSLSLIKDFIKIGSNDDSIVLDFFSGSSTTAHGVMQLNAEDDGKRKYIMVQVSEPISESSEAYKLGYHNIIDVGMERIRRAGKKIKEESGKEDLDIGFRVFKLDTSNIRNISEIPENTTQNSLEGFVNFIEPGRGPEDLLIQVMLQLGIELSAPIAETTINGHKVFDVDDGYMIACFDDGMDIQTVTEISKTKSDSIYAVFFSGPPMTDDMLSNIEQIFKTYSPQTKIRIL